MATKSRTTKKPVPSSDLSVVNTEMVNSEPEISELYKIKMQINVIGRKVFGASWDEFE